MQQVAVVALARRSALAITVAVWKALFLREALTRLFAGRATWMWVLIEPVFHVSYLVVIFTVIRLRRIGGIDTALWVVLGMLAFFMFRRTAMQSRTAISANRALFSYRQVKPVDTVLVRGFLEGFLMVLVSLVLLAGLQLFGHPVWPGDPLTVLAALGGLWVLGMGFGLCASVARELVPESDSPIKMLMLPLYFISGVIAPLTSVPPAYREWFTWNPVAHGIEVLRKGFAPYYAGLPEASLAYLLLWALILLFAGLALHRFFVLRLSSL